MVVRRAPFSSLFTNPAVLCAYVGGGLQMFIAAVMLAWLPSFFNRVLRTAHPDRAAVIASGFVLLIGTGMVVCGYHHRPGEPHRYRPQMDGGAWLLPDRASPA